MRGWAMAAGTVGALWVGNTSVGVEVDWTPERWVIAHRGVHQTYHREALTAETCTATRIDSPRHGFLENTLPSMRAAFDAGADVVEIDVHPTTDGDFAVFHDWTLDCRTDGTGVTRQASSASLSQLDIGHGYTADGGRTFPFRGKGVGQMPMLSEVFAEEGRYLINVKSNDPEEGRALHALFEAHPEWERRTLGFYGGDEPVRVMLDHGPTRMGFSKRSTKSCLGEYVAAGWTGWVPEACRHTLVAIPLNVAPWLWGWPERFQSRMQAVGSTVILVGDVQWGDMGTTGIDSMEAWSRIPDSFRGFVWRDRVEEAVNE